ncbi:hypothetical protein CXB51_008992 [Gossypium anomalum]|uniref:Retrovirus-related Pol polyprotein from transposon TNT 1-94 n=1 Tax=Gossypium anomalum TaxID=47600 RepID=A0A8J5ZRW2_9ROSI|nr:hypothetical protein CXB51_008992 [Gossypium anomalum]
MQKSKPVSVPLVGDFKFSSRQSPTSEKKKEEMEKVSYLSAVGSFMYAIICTRPNIAHVVGIVSRFLSNQGKVHWEGELSLGSQSSKNVWHYQPLNQNTLQQLKRAKRCYR